VQDVFAAAALLSAWWARRAARSSKRNGATIAKVHGLVNGQLADAVDRADVAEARSAVLESNDTERARQDDSFDTEPQ